MGKLWLLASLLGYGIVSWSAPAAGASTGQKPHEHQELSRSFVENKGQWTTEAKYKVSLSEGALFLTDNGLVYNFFSKDDMQHVHDASTKEQEEHLVVHAHAYKVNFEGSNPGVSYTASDKSETYYNYYIGNDPRQWASHVSAYGTVVQHDIYNGIDFKIYRAAEHEVKYDFIVHPGADPQQIRLTFEGVSPRLLPDGTLQIQTSVNSVKELAPLTYQLIEGKKVIVPSAYKLEKGTLSYRFPKGYNKDYELIIDPSVVFATYSGSTNSNPFDGGVYGYGTTYDNDGNTYTSASLFAWGWPTTTGAYQTTVPSTISIGINKYNANGSQLM